MERDMAEDTYDLISMACLMLFYHRGKYRPRAELGTTLMEEYDHLEQSWHVISAEERSLCS